jgi:predicted O-methyltransferase YrrM
MNEPIPFAGYVEVDLEFTADWFSNNIHNFEQCMLAIPEKKMFLEVGAFEGRATCWMLQNALNANGHIMCIDPYAKFDFDPSIDMKAVEQRFWNNIRVAVNSTQSVSAFKEPSYQALSEMIGFKYAFDFIYLDGSHAPDVTLTDACMAWGLLKKHGVMLFDDYLYPHEPTKIGIDGFLNAFKGQYEIIVSNYQIGIQRL